MLERLIEQWLTQSPQREDAVLRFVEQGGALPTQEELKRAANNPLVRAYLRKGLELFTRMADDVQAASQIHVLRWRIETVLEAMDQLQAQP
jgi:methionine synthase II (cobalamin-independent)